MKIYRMALISPDLWNNIDWSKTTSQIAFETGQTSSYVSNMRARFAKHTIIVRNPSKGDEFWKNVDWEHKSTKEISLETGVKENTVSKIRKKYAPHTLIERKGDDFWRNIDWEHKSNADISNETGFDHFHIQKNRNRFAIDTNYAIRLRNLLRNIDWSKSNSEIFNILAKTENGLKVSMAFIIKYRKILAPQTIQEEHGVIDYSGVDWNKSNKQIGKEVGVSGATVKRERERRGLPPSVWGDPNRIGNPKHDWESVDWTQSTTKIANELVSQMIEKYDLDPSEISPSYYSSLRSQISTQRSHLAPHTMDTRGRHRIPGLETSIEPDAIEFASSLNWYKRASL